MAKTGDALEVVFCVLHLHLSTKMNPKGGTRRNRMKKKKERHGRRNKRDQVFAGAG